MLQPPYRLAKKRDFDLLLKHGRWVKETDLSLKYLNLSQIIDLFPKKENPEDFQKQLKLAFSVGLKVSKSAVERNRLRRQLREVVRLLLKEGRLKTGFYVMLIPDKTLLEADYEKIKDKVSVVLQRSGILKA